MYSKFSELRGLICEKFNFRIFCVSAFEIAIATQRKLSSTYIHTNHDKSTLLLTNQRAPYNCYRVMLRSTSFIRM